MGRHIDQAGKSDADRRHRRRRGLFFRHLSGYRQDLIGQRASGFPRLFRIRLAAEGQNPSRRVNRSDTNVVTTQVYSEQRKLVGSSLRRLSWSICLCHRIHPRRTITPVEEAVNFGGASIWTLARSGRTLKWGSEHLPYAIWHMLAMSGGIKYLYAFRIAVPAHFVSR